MTTTKSTSLRKLLAEAYPPESKNAPDQFRIDDRSNDDRCLSFCTIQIAQSKSNPNELALTLGNVPYDTSVENLVRELGGEWLNGRFGKSLTLSLTPEQFPAVKQLAKLIRQVTAPGKQYLDSNWKWVSRRTATSLDRLAKVLAKFKHG